MRRMRRRIEIACLFAAGSAWIRTQSDVSPRTATARAEAEYQRALWKVPQFLRPILRLGHEAHCCAEREAGDRAVGNSSLAGGPVLRAGRASGERQRPTCSVG